MSLYDEARDLVIDGLENIIAEDTEESVRSIHVQSIVYRLMDQV